MNKVSTMNLFGSNENMSTLFGLTPGFRLHKLEVLNWGTFDKTVWGFFPQGETALLTGDVGSGKSTLVDALITLIVPPRKVAYNKAADSSAKERTVTTYIKGNHGQKRSAEGTEPEALRGVNHYSVLLATFHDRGLGQFVTIAQFFWFNDAQMPDRFYVVADKEMEIAQDFARFNQDVRALKKRLKQNDDVQVFDDYSRYAGVFRRKFGIEQEQALDLFQQTISMKKVEALTDFVRANMLEPPNTEEDVEKLIQHFYDLNSAHEAVLKARNQIESLKPLVEKGDRCERFEIERDLLESARGALPSWFAEQMLVLLDAEIVNFTKKLELVTAEYTQAESEQIRIEESIDAIKDKIFASGGGALEALKQELQNLQKELVRIGKSRANYENFAVKLALPLPATIDVFIDNRRILPELKSDEEQKQGQITDDYAIIVTEENKLRQELKNVSGELESLRSRKSSIPRANIEKRKQLCQELRINEDELPFVGELLEVREEEQCWEGAIERLLHNFGLSLLVPDQHYQSVAKWVDKTFLDLRLVYYRIRPDAATYQVQHSHELSVSQKLNIKPNTHFGIWLSRELNQRFPHVCCADMDQFHREIQAITQAGQIKTKGDRHEKDDRYDINDRKRFILGFSNRKKIAALEDDERKLKDKVKSCQDLIIKNHNEQKSSQDRLNAIGEIERTEDFADIDTRSKKEEITEKEQCIAKLEQENDVLQGLRLQLTELEIKKDSHKKIVNDTQQRKIYLSKDIEELQKKKDKNLNAVGEVTKEARETIFPVLEQRKTLALGDIKLTLDNEDKLKRNYETWLSSETSKLINEIRVLSNAVVHLMTQYRNDYPENTTEVDASLKSLPEYKNMLEQLEKDGLPRFEQRFKKLLHENTINQIALFQAKLKREQDTIRNRIEQINGSLSAIDYNEGRYIRLEYDETYDSDIKEFRVQLRACTEGALTGSEDEQYAEVKFLQVKAIIERFKGRPGEADWDARWTKKVIDVRNWFLFAASERWRETDEEYEHYKDSSGKSGGQKEKLAYTILAASLVYHFGLEGQDVRSQSFRFVVIDEAFLKSSDESARFGLELFKKLDLQLLIVTPLLKIPTIEPYINHVGFVHHDDLTHQSMLRNISVEEYKREKQVRKGILDA